MHEILTLKMLCVGSLVVTEVGGGIVVIIVRFSMLFDCRFITWLGPRDELDIV